MLLFLIAGSLALGKWLKKEFIVWQILFQCPKEKSLIFLAPRTISFWHWLMLIWDSESASCWYRLYMCRAVSSVVAKKESVKTSVETFKIPMARTSGVNLANQQAKNVAVTQAQQDGCTGQFRIFDSPFGNFLVPVIPTPAELAE